MLPRFQAIREARSSAAKAVPFFVANAALPPALILALSRLEPAVVYTLLYPLIAYFALCLLSLALLLAGRGALAEGSLQPAQRLLLLAGILGLFTGLAAGGLLALRARKLVQTVGGKGLKEGREGLQRSRRERGGSSAADSQGSAAEAIRGGSAQAGEGG